ncbi:MAG: NUDIX hydrolase [Gammaproteobacteria bacterium]|nr:NUDIX hydrolase [Gammaproteobacteria bacterium]
MQQTIANFICNTILDIEPLDNIEQKHIDDTLEWIRSGAPIFRTVSPDVPNKHLVSYIVLFDEGVSKILLVDHKKSGLWLPPGGHVDLDELPLETARRECFEELQIEADFWSKKPIFLTSTITVGLTAGHTDVSLWYVIKGNHKDGYNFDKGEFNGVRWFNFHEIPYEKSDPHLGRFITKLEFLLKD